MTAIEVLINTRVDVGVKPTNPFIFASEMPTPHSVVIPSYEK